MRMTNRALCLLLTLALAVPAMAVPATAFGQSAGDDQYVDPFQDEPNNGQGNQGNGNDTPASEEPVAQAPDTGDTEGASAAEDVADDGATLPRTGLPIVPIALIGVILLGAGLTLRRAWPLPD